MSVKLYQEELLDHFKNPRNHGKLENANFCSGDENPSCGDEISIEGIITNGVVKAVQFTGKGCVLSQASASMLTELCEGKKVEEVLSLSKDDMLKMVGLELGPNRLRCILLPLQALKKGIFSYQSNLKLLK